MIAGIPPATEAPNSRRLPISPASSTNSGPLSAIRSLFAVTTGLPARNALRIHSPAGVMPPTSSTKMSASDESTSSILSVQRPFEGAQSTFFRLTLRLKICVNSKESFASSHSSLATDRPTVPKPARAILNFLWEGLFFLFMVSGLFLDLDFERFGFADNSSPRWEQEQASPSH